MFGCGLRTLPFPIELNRNSRRNSNKVACKGRSQFVFFRCLIPTLPQYVLLTSRPKKLLYGFRLSARTFGVP